MKVGLEMLFMTKTNKKLKWTLIALSGIVLSGLCIGVSTSCNASKETSNNKKQDTLNDKLKNKKQSAKSCLRHH
ncbi:hypothetical protein [Ureaplasma urealyticum]|uniref:hypothetical protein n=1 Tax=Ureaplasma urealyticum TaxID=2130 RepID=UPI00215B7F20|nr:hypothetical protein [Ureaplasma urealyticum]